MFSEVGMSRTVMDAYTLDVTHHGGHQPLLQLSPRLRLCKHQASGELLQKSSLRQALVIRCFQDTVSFHHYVIYVR